MMIREVSASFRAAGATVMALGIFASCDPGEAPCLEDVATRVRFDPRIDTSEWLSHPFPSDHRLLEGKVDFFGFPNPGGSDLVDGYLAESEGMLDGFGLNTPIYFAFDAPIDVGSIPAAPEDFLTADAPVQLVDVDPDSPERGRRFPLRRHYTEESDGFRPAHTLAVAPLWGFPLREATTYAVLLTRDVLDAEGLPIAPGPLEGVSLCEDERCSAGLSESKVASARELLAPVRELWSEEGRDLQELASATVFTTQNATGELRRMREVVQELDPPAVTRWRVFETGRTFEERSFKWAPYEYADYYVMEGYFSSPYFLEGSIPYSRHADGGFISSDQGVPQVVRQEELRFALTIPAEPPPSGSCYPIVQYAHGTGGDAHGFTYSSGGRLAGRRLAGIGLDQPLHGTRNDGRSFDVSLLTFNVNNIHSTRSLFRQSAADTFSLTRMLKNGLVVPAEQSPTGEEICFTADPLLFLGHSQGGITGSLAAAFEEDVSAWMLSGSGGGVSITLIERKDPLDVAALLAMLAGLDEGAIADEYHPLVMLVHTLTEVTDPLNYSPRWLQEDGSRHFLVTSGENDVATPYKTALAKTAAAGIPLVRPAGTDVSWHDLAGLPPVFEPLRNNANEATAGHIHWPDGDHFVVFSLREAIHASMHFLETAAEGEPVIVRDPDALVF